ncbi:restriction endonuclease subunit S [Rhodoferax sp. U11-2br]|uniref:restriction endonuclease subunit S n=1 Tax=Rhodoferax sp. U11-2br TaxID=2838878 RepID=UPI001BE77C2F|nr:restriction endonuclease subunit S [Rhodoferax sp. U11-2br]MBT3065484.1 restriction endonuclease subunit S [Rhodoferax sp. U11-2br]
MLLSNLDFLATAPGGVSRLRELILTLAVQGKLVPQDLNDEPASELLKRMGAEKDGLIVAKKIRRSKPLDPIDDNECGFVLPSNWEWARLGNLGDWGAGATPSRTNSNYYGGKIPWFKSGELTADFISDSEETVTDAALRDCSLRLNQVGDVLIAMYGATIGKTSILSVVATTNQAVCACTPFAGLSSAYLLLLMKALKPYFISIGAGGAQPNISREKVIATVIGLPPLVEQSRIVTRVEELMRLCDALEAKGQLEAAQHAQLVATLLGALTDSDTPAQLAENWQRVASHFDLLLDRPQAVDALEQTILQLAVRGLIVPQDPQDEPASALLQKIRAEKDKLIAEGKIKRDKPLPPIAEDDQPFALPPGWCWARFPELGEFGRGKSKHRPRNDPALFNPPKYPLIQTGEVSRAKGVVQEVHSYYSDLGLEQSRMWPKGTLCITIAANIAESATLGFDSCFPDSVVGFVPARAMGNVEYFLLFVETAKADLLAFAPATAQKNINLEILSSLLIPLPPLNELARIVTRVTQLRQLCAELRARLSASQSTQAQLAEALVDSVGAGEPVVT